MRWAYVAIWSGWFISLIKTQSIPGSYLGFPNCTDPCDSILLAPGSGCDFFALNQSTVISCLCRDTSLFDTVVACVVSHCTPSDAEASFEIAVGVCHDIGLSLPTPSVSGFTLTAMTFASSTAITSFSSPVSVSSAAATSLASLATASASSIVATSAVSTVVSTIAQSSNVATTTSSYNMTATSSSNTTVFTGEANAIIANNLLLGLGLSLYCALL